MNDKKKINLHFIEIFLIILLCIVSWFSGLFIGCLTHFDRNDFKNVQTPILANNVTIKKAREEFGSLNSGSCLIAVINIKPSTIYNFERVIGVRLDYSTGYVLSESNVENGLLIEQVTYHFKYYFSSPIIVNDSSLNRNYDFVWNENVYSENYGYFNMPSSVYIEDSIIQDSYMYNYYYFSNGELEIETSYFDLSSQYYYVDLATYISPYDFSYMNSIYYSYNNFISVFSRGDIDLFYEGNRVGYGDGFSDGEINKQQEYESTDSAFERVWNIISNAFASVFNVFNIDLVGGLKLFHILAIPLIISVLFFVIKVLAK